MQERSITLLDAPSNLGLRPPEAGAVPGVYKLAGALRDHGLLGRLGALDAGVVTPPRYRASWTPGEGDRNGDAIAAYSVQLAGRIGAALDSGSFLLVLGGDCSVLLGAMLALRRRGRFGLAYLDGHSDFRHPDNAPAVGAAGGEALAIVTGRGDHRLVDLDGLSPYTLELDAVALGMRHDDEHLGELAEVGIRAWTSRTIRQGSPAAVAAEAVSTCARQELDGFWIHLDVDVLDPGVMPAVDSPDPGGLDLDELEALLAALVSHELAVGMDVCIFDPDLDPGGTLAGTLADMLVTVLGSRDR